jgi:hypothetical protein
MARDGRCVIHLNQIAAETPPEHIHAAVAACHTYGRHPIPDNLEDIHFEMPERESFAEFMQAKGESFNTSPLAQSPAYSKTTPKIRLKGLG